jgi:hypothetical protein
MNLQNMEQLNRAGRLAELALCQRPVMPLRQECLGDISERLCYFELSVATGDQFSSAPERSRNLQRLRINAAGPSRGRSRDTASKHRMADEKSRLRYLASPSS